MVTASLHPKPTAPSHSGSVLCKFSFITTGYFGVGVSPEQMVRHHRQAQRRDNNISLSRRIVFSSYSHVGVRFLKSPCAGGAVWKIQYWTTGAASDGSFKRSVPSRVIHKRPEEKSPERVTHTIREFQVRYVISPLKSALPAAGYLHQPMRIPQLRNLIAVKSNPGFSPSIQQFLCRLRR